MSKKKIVPRPLEIFLLGPTLPQEWDLQRGPLISLALLLYSSWWFHLLFPSELLRSCPQWWSQWQSALQWPRPQRTKQRAQWNHCQHPRRQRQRLAWLWTALQASPQPPQTLHSTPMDPRAPRGGILYSSLLSPRANRAQARPPSRAPAWNTACSCSVAVSVALSPPVKSGWWITWRSTRETSSASSSTKSSSSKQKPNQASKQQSETCPPPLYSNTDPAL